jgi:hypothetical protein
LSSWLRATFFLVKASSHSTYSKKTCSTWRRRCYSDDQEVRGEAEVPFDVFNIEKKVEEDGVRNTCTWHKVRNLRRWTLFLNHRSSCNFHTGHDTPAFIYPLDAANFFYIARGCYPSVVLVCLV